MESGLTPRSSDFNLPHCAFIELIDAFVSFLLWHILFFYLYIVLLFEGSSMAEGGGQGEAMQIAGLPEALIRGMFARCAERAAPTANHRAGSLLRAIAAEDGDCKLLHDR
jgi:hypothetical protein